MMRTYVTIAFLMTFFVSSGCNMQRSFNDDVAFLEKHVEVITLSSIIRLAKVAVVPQ